MLVSNASSTSIQSSTYTTMPFNTMTIEDMQNKTRVYQAFWIMAAIQVTIETDLVVESTSSSRCDIFV